MPVIPLAVGDHGLVVDRVKTVSRCLLAVMAIAVAVGCSPERPTLSDTAAPRRCSADGRQIRYDSDGLPSPIARQRGRLIEAALRCDYQALDRLAVAGGLVATFDGDAVAPADWPELEHDGLPVMLGLAEVLTLTPARDPNGITWPAAVRWSRLADGDAAEQQALTAVAGESGLITWSAQGDYLGWRTTIDSSGAWTAFAQGVSSES